jgi:hypothetical protein
MNPPQKSRLLMARQQQFLKTFIAQGLKTSKKYMNAGISAVR